MIRKGFDHFLLLVTFRYRGLNHLEQYCILTIDSSLAIISLRKRELFALLQICSCCHVDVCVYLCSVSLPYSFIDL